MRYLTHKKHQPSPRLVDALSLMMSSQRQQSQPGIPVCVPVRHKKDKLFNDVLGMLKDKKLFFPASEILSTGTMFVKVLVDCLWYLDGHHETLKRQSCPIPDIFSSFIGYNAPELSKHRKRKNVNMSSSVLKFLASSLFQHLQAPFWSSNPLWQTFHQQTLSLAKSLADYADYLSMQNKTMKSIHCRSSPVRQISNSLSLKYVSTCGGAPLRRFEALYCLNKLTAMSTYF